MGNLFLVLRLVGASGPFFHAWGEPRKSGRSMAGVLSFSQVLMHTDLTLDDRRWLEGLTEQWGILADLAFSDLICWVPDVDDNIFWAAAQCRPSTGPTALADDVVGEDISYDVEHLVTEAYLSRNVAVTSSNKLDAGIPVDVHAVPVIRQERCIAVIELHTNRMGIRAPGALEDAYLEAAEALMGMVHRAEFPMPGDKPVEWSSPRVGDGLIRIGPDGVVTFASPNAVSTVRRLGWNHDLLGEDFGRIVAALSEAQRTTGLGHRAHPHHHAVQGVRCRDDDRGGARADPAPAR